MNENFVNRVRIYDYILQQIRKVIECKNKQQFSALIGSMNRYKSMYQNYTDLYFFNECFPGTKVKITYRVRYTKRETIEDIRRKCFKLYDRVERERETYMLQEDKSEMAKLKRLDMYQIAVTDFYDFIFSPNTSESFLSYMHDEPRCAYKYWGEYYSQCQSLEAGALRLAKHVSPGELLDWRKLIRY